MPGTLETPHKTCYVGTKKGSDLRVRGATEGGPGRTVHTVTHNGHIILYEEQCIANFNVIS